MATILSISLFTLVVIGLCAYAKNHEFLFWFSASLMVGGMAAFWFTLSKGQSTPEVVANLYTAFAAGVISFLVSRFIKGKK